MKSKTKKIGKQMKMVQELFDELYLVMNQEGADPAHCAYSVYSVEVDIRNIVLGRLQAKK
jgi:hypothetical protein